MDLVITRRAVLVFALSAPPHRLLGLAFATDASCLLSPLQRGEVLAELHSAQHAAREALHALGGVHLDVEQFLLADGFVQLNLLDKFTVIQRKVVEIVQVMVRNTIQEHNRERNASRS